MDQMIAHHIQRRHQDGFSLVELAIVLLIVGLLAGGMLMPITAQQDQRSKQVTDGYLEAAKEAIVGFALVHDRLPCPASDASQGLESFGQESFCQEATGATCTMTTTRPAHGRCAVAYTGFLPAVSIGYQPISPTGYATDAWGATDVNRIRYAITKYSLTPSSNVTTCQTTPPSAVDYYPFSCEGGLRSIFDNVLRTATTADLSVCNSASAITGNPPSCTAGTALIGDAVAVIFSRGKNASSPVTGTDEAPNLNDDRAFVSANFSRGTVPSTSDFDDQIVWISKGMLVFRLNSAGRLDSAQ